MQEDNILDDLDPLAVASSDKVKCTLVQALRLCTRRTAHKGSTVE